MPVDHPLSPVTGALSADWFLPSLEPWLGRQDVRVASLVPPMPEVCRVLHPWWLHDREGRRAVSWSEVAAARGLTGPEVLDASRDAVTGQMDAASFDTPLRGEMDGRTAAALVAVLGAATTTPGEVYFGVWKGWADIHKEMLVGAAVISTEGRGHVLLRGPLDGALTSMAVADAARPVSGLWWPADHAWFVATEVDLEWTFVAGTHALVEQLLADDTLEVLPTTRASRAARLAGH